jgi:DNA-binding NarL/FixJ family response regulator
MSRREEEDDSSSTFSVNYKEPDLSGRRDSGIHPEADWRAVRLPVISVAVIDKHLFTRECITRSLQALGANFDIASYARCDDCLQNTTSPDIVLYHAHTNHTNDSDDEEQLAYRSRLLKIAPLVILSPFDCPKSILQALESGARGYIPVASTSVEQAIEIIRLVRAGGTFVPQSSLSLQLTNRRGGELRAITTHPLTPRQIEILGRLKLGKSNKIIAHELGVSESTVKVDIHNIMKKMKATNRTEAACRAYAFAPGWDL